MRFPKIKPIRVLSVATALSLMFSAPTFAVSLNESDSGTLTESDIPIEVGSLVTGTALGVGTVEAAGVHVRSNPNMDADIITNLSQGEQVIILSKDGDWYRVSAEGFNGFVYSDYMSLAEEGTGELGYAEIKTSSANIRASADTDSEVISSLSEEDVLTIVGVQDGWYEVEANGVTGYIRSDLADPTADIPAEKIYDYAVVDVNGINLRSEPDAASEKLDMLYDTSLCTLLEQDGDWYKVQYGDTVGYVLASYMDTTNDATEGSTEIETQNEVIEREAEEAAAAQAAAEAAAAEEAARQAAAQASAPASTSVSSASSSSSSSSASSASSYTTQSYENVSSDTSTTSTPDSESISSEAGSSGSTAAVESVSAPASTVSSAASTSGNSSIVSVAKNYMGVPYVWGGTSPSGFDCSGFTQYVFRQCGYSISRTADAQYRCGSYVSYSNLSAGDLIFFCNTYSSSGITHVGIYIGGGQFIHCASGGVKISSLSESYYASRYYAACRIA